MPDFLQTATTLAQVLPLLGLFLTNSFAVYSAIRQRQWDKAVQKAGDIALDLARLTSFDNQTKRQMAVSQLSSELSGFSRGVLKQKDLEMIVEAGYQFVTKPKLRQEQGEFQPEEITPETVCRCG